MRHSSLRTQIVLPLALLTLVLAAAAVYVGQARIQAAAERSANEWASVRVHAAAASVESVRLGELDRLEHTLRLLVALPEVHLIEVSDPQGRPVIAMSDTHSHAQGTHWQEEGQGAKTFESLGMRLNGQPFDAELSVASVDMGLAPEFAFVLRDFTAKTRARTALLERTARLNTVPSLSAEGIVFFDRQQRLSYINPSMLELLQPLRIDQLMGRTLVQFEALLVEKSLAEHAYQPRAVEANGSWRVRTDGPAPPFTLLGAGERILTCTWRQAGPGHEELVVFFRDVTQQVTLDRMTSEFLTRCRTFPA